MERNPLNLPNRENNADSTFIWEPMLLIMFFVRLRCEALVVLSNERAKLSPSIVLSKNYSILVPTYIELVLSGFGQ